MNELVDKHSRPLNYLRISVTDRCNYRCSYCMPKEIFNNNYKFLRRDDLMTFEENLMVVEALSELGLTKVRLTGGEPLLRKNIEKLVSSIKSVKNIKEVTLTTNGSLLNPLKITQLYDNGLESITISLDSLNVETNNAINPYHVNDSVIEAIKNATNVFKKVKVNFVVIKNVNDSEILNTISQFKDFKIQLRFIEFMDVGQTNNWNKNDVISSDQIIDKVRGVYEINKIISPKSSTAELWSINNANIEIGVISSISKPFCHSCNRGRLSADGKFFTCLFSNQGEDILSLIRSGMDKKGLVKYFSKIWRNRDDRYSLDRSNLNSKKSKIEMSYIGG